jgi:hypothetical protein
MLKDCYSIHLLPKRRVSAQKETLMMAQERLEEAIMTLKELS